MMMCPELRMRGTRLRAQDARGAGFAECHICTRKSLYIATFCDLRVREPVHSEHRLRAEEVPHERVCAL